MIGWESTALRPLSTVAVEQGRAMNSQLSLSENRSQTNHEPLRKREEIRAGPCLVLSLTAVTQLQESERARVSGSRGGHLGLGSTQTSQTTIYLDHLLSTLAISNAGFLFQCSGTNTMCTIVALNVIKPELRQNYLDLGSSMLLPSSKFLPLAQLS